MFWKCLCVQGRALFQVVFWVALASSSNVRRTPFGRHGHEAEHRSSSSHLEEHSSSAGAGQCEQRTHEQAARIETWASAPGPFAYATVYVGLILFMSHAAALAFGFWLGKSASSPESQHAGQAEQHPQEASVESVPVGGTGRVAQCSTVSPPSKLEGSTEAASGQNKEPSPLNSTPSGPNTWRLADQRDQVLSSPDSLQQHTIKFAQSPSLSCTATSVDSLRTRVLPDALAPVEHSNSREDVADGPNAAGLLDKQGRETCAADGPEGEGIRQPQNGPSGAMHRDESQEQHHQEQEQEQWEVVHEQLQQGQGQQQQHQNAAEMHHESGQHPSAQTTPQGGASTNSCTSLTASIMRHVHEEQHQQGAEGHTGSLPQHLSSSVSEGIICLAEAGRHAPALSPAASSALGPHPFAPSNKPSEVVVRIKFDVGQLRQLIWELGKDLVDYTASILSEQLRPIKQPLLRISSGVDRMTHGVERVINYIDHYSAAIRLKKQQALCTVCVKVGLLMMLGALLSASVARGAPPFLSPLWQYKCAAGQGSSSWFSPKNWTSQLLGAHPLMWYPGLFVCFLVEIGSFIWALVALAVGAYVVLPLFFRELHRAWMLMLPLCLGAAGGYAGMNLVWLMQGAPMVWLFCWELWVGLCCVMYVKEIRSFWLRNGLASVLSVVLPLATGYLPFHDAASG